MEPAGGASGSAGGRPTPSDDLLTLSCDSWIDFQDPAFALEDFESLVGPLGTLGDDDVEDGPLDHRKHGERVRMVAEMIGKRGGGSMTGGSSRQPPSAVAEWTESLEDLETYLEKLDATVAELGRGTGSASALRIDEASDENEDSSETKQETVSVDDNGDSNINQKETDKDKIAGKKNNNKKKKTTTTQSAAHEKPADGKKKAKPAKPAKKPETQQQQQQEQRGGKVRVDPGSTRKKKTGVKTTTTTTATTTTKTNTNRVKKTKGKKKPPRAGENDIRGVSVGEKSECGEQQRPGVVVVQDSLLLQQPETKMMAASCGKPVASVESQLLTLSDSDDDGEDLVISDDEDD